MVLIMRSRQGSDESADEWAGTGVVRREASRQVGEAPARFQDGSAREFYADTARTLGVPTEEGAAPERARGVDATAPVRPEQRAGSLCGKGKLARSGPGGSGRVHRMPHFFELHGCRVGLASGHGEVAARRFAGGAAGAGASPPAEHPVYLGVERKQFRPMHRVDPAGCSRAHQPANRTPSGQINAEWISRRWLQ